MSVEQLAVALSEVEEADIIWKKLISCRRARWSPGMAGAYKRTERATVLSVNIDGWPLAWECRGRLMGAPYTDDEWTWRWFPLWSDPATCGALLGQARARYMDPTIYARPDEDGWRLYNALGPVDPQGCPRSAWHEVGALLCGLECAP